jgi:TPR repeat protein
MKSVILPLLFLLTIPAAANNLASTVNECGQSIASSDKSLMSLPACKAIIDTAEKGVSEAYFQLGKLIVNSNKPSNRRLKKGLFYLVLAADDGHKQAASILSQYVKSKMIGGKIPLRHSHYVSYVEMDWQAQGKSDQHHYAAYERWLEQVEQARIAPQKMSAQTLVEMATDYENGYFLGGDLNKALKLYKIAAKKGHSTAQFKAGEMLFDSNKTQAIAYLQQAARNQSSDAMLKLGDHFGCQGNKQKALLWYEKAIKQGNEYAVDEKAALVKTGKPTQCN